MSVKFSKIVKGPTPNGGDRLEYYYLDKKRNRCTESQAFSADVHEYKGDELLSRFHIQSSTK